MDLFGFHPIDVILLVGYLALITYIGKRNSRKIKSQEDFFMAGRGIGKLFQIFLNMSTITDVGQALHHNLSYTFKERLSPERVFRNIPPENVTEYRSTETNHFFERM